MSAINQPNDPLHAPTFLSRQTFLEEGFVQQPNTEGAACPIELEVPEQMCRLKYCGHLFSLDGLTEWVYSDPAPTCPICRCRLFILEEIEGGISQDCIKEYGMSFAAQHAPVFQITAARARKHVPELTDEQIRTAIYNSTQVYHLELTRRHNDTAQISVEKCVAAAAAMGTVLEWYYTHVQRAPLEVGLRDSWQVILDVTMELLSTEWRRGIFDRFDLEDMLTSEVNDRTQKQLQQSDDEWLLPGVIDWFEDWSSNHDGIITPSGPRLRHTFFGWVAYMVARMATHYETTLPQDQQGDMSEWEQPLW